MSAPLAAWIAAPASALLLALFLWRGPLRARLLFDALAIGVAIGAATAAALAPFDLKSNPLHFSPLTLAFLFAGLPEEAVKMIGAVAFLRGHYLARGARDVTLAGGALGLGFATLENLFYLAGAGSDWATLAVERGLTAVPFHAFLGLAAGFAAARFGSARIIAAWLGLAAIHGVYDFSVFAGAAGAQTPPIFARAIAAAGLDQATALRLTLAGAEIAAALAAAAALRAVRGEPATPTGGRLVRFARSRGLGITFGAVLIALALTMLAAAAGLAFLADSAAAFANVALLAILPLAHGLMFFAFPAYVRRPMSRAWRRGFAAAGALAAVAIAAAAIVWGPQQWRRAQALQEEARGARLTAHGDYEAAVKSFTLALPDSPDRIGVLARRAGANTAANHYDAALADLDAALKLNPQTALYAQRAGVDRQRNDPQATVADLDAALKLKAGDPDLLALRGQALLEAGDRPRAAADLAQARAIAPDDALAQVVTAAYDADGGDYDGALQQLNARLHASPGDNAAAFQRGRVWYFKRDTARALADFARADRDAGFLYPALWRFLAASPRGDREKAALEQRLAVAPNKWPAPVAWMWLGRMSFDTARAAASNDNERCEADFYFAASRLGVDSNDVSATRLQAAVAECPTAFIEYEGAKAELRRLGR